VAALATKFDSLEKPSEVKIVMPKSLLNGSLPRNVTLTSKPPASAVKKKPSARGSKVRQVVSTFEQVSVKAVPAKLVLDNPPTVIKIGTAEKKNVVAITQVPKERKAGYKGDFRSGKTKKTEGRTLVLIDFEDGGNIDGVSNDGLKTDSKLPTKKSDEVDKSLNEPKEESKLSNLNGGGSAPVKKSFVHLNGPEKRVEELSVSDKTKLFGGLASEEVLVPNKSKLHGNLPKVAVEKQSSIEIPVGDSAKPQGSLQPKAEVPVANKSKLYGSLNQTKTPVANNSKLHGSLQKEPEAKEAVPNSRLRGSLQKLSEAAGALPNNSRLHGSLQKLSGATETDTDNSKIHGSLQKQSDAVEVEPIKSRLHGSLQKNSEAHRAMPITSKLHGSLQKLSEATEKPNLSRLHGSLQKLSDTAKKSSFHGSLQILPPIEAPDIPIPNKSKLHGSLLKLSSEVQKPEHVAKPTEENPKSVQANASFLWRKNSTPAPPTSPPPMEEPDKVYTAIPVMIDSEYDDVGPGENVYDDIGINTRTSSNDVHAEGYETCDGSTYDDCEGEGYQFVDGSASHNVSDGDNLYDDVGASSNHDNETSYEAIDVKPRPLPMPPPVVATPNPLFKGYGRPGAGLQQTVGRHDSICSSASSSRSGSGGAGSYCEKINSIYGGVISELGAGEQYPQF